MPRKRNSPDQQPERNDDAPPPANPAPVNPPAKPSRSGSRDGKQKSQNSAEEGGESAEIPQGNLRQLVEKIEITDWIIAVATAIIAIATIVNVEVVDLQWAEMKSTREDTERLFRTDERAWIDLGETRILDSREETGNPTTFVYAIPLKNVGKTLADNVVVRMYNSSEPFDFGSKADEVARIQDVALVNLDMTHRHIDGDAFSEYMPKVIAPNSTTAVPIYALGMFPADQVKGGPGRSYMIGRIDYTDVWGTSRWTKFCLYVATHRGDLRYCAAGNDKGPKEKKESG